MDKKTIGRRIKDRRLALNWKSEAATLDIQGYPAFSPTLLWRLVPSKSRSPFRHKGKN